MHSAVAVICEHPDFLDSIMEDYNEELEVESYIYLTKAQLIEQERKSLEHILNTSYKDFQENEEEFQKNVPETHYEFIINDFMKLYKANDEELFKYIKSWYDEGSFDKDENLIRNSNPRGKWDWWVLGGRWSGMLITKNGYYSDAVKIKDISFELMRAESNQPFKTNNIIPFEEEWREIGDIWNLEEKEQALTIEEWMAELREIIESANPEHYLAIIDYHY